MNEINGVNSNISAALANTRQANASQAGNLPGLNNLCPTPPLPLPGLGSPCGGGLLGMMGSLVSQLAQVVQSLVGMLSNLLGGGQAAGSLDHKSFLSGQMDLSKLASGTSSKLGFFDTFSNVATSLLGGGIGGLVDGVGSLLSGGGIGSVVKKAGSFIKKLF